MRIIGCDPGISGGIGVIEGSGHYVEAFELPTVLANKSSNRRMVDAYGLAAELRRINRDAGGDIKAICEAVNAMPGQGVSSMFAFGKSYGIILGVIAAIGISTELVAPQRWKKHFGLSGPDKDQGRELAIRLFPTCPLPRKKDHGRADALLIAKYFAETGSRRV